MIVGKERLNPEDNRKGSSTHTGKTTPQAEITDHEDAETSCLIRKKKNNTKSDIKGILPANWNHANSLDDVSAASSFTVRFTRDIIRTSTEISTDNSP